MRRATTIAVLLSLCALAGCSDDTTGTSSETTVEGPASTAAPAPAEATAPDLNDPLLAAFDEALAGLDADTVTAGTARLDVATPGQDWSAEMYAALTASFCNDWESDDSRDGGVGPLTDQGKADWAGAVATPLSISEADARLAIDALLEDPGFSPPCQ